MNFLHRNHIFDVIIGRSDYDIKILIIKLKARGTKIEHVDRINIYQGCELHRILTEFEFDKNVRVQVRVRRPGLDRSQWHAAFLLVKS